MYKLLSIAVHILHNLAATLLGLISVLPYIQLYFSYSNFYALAIPIVSSEPKV